MMIPTTAESNGHGKMAQVAAKTTSLLTSASFLLSTVLGSLSPAYAQTIVDPKAPIQFQPGITSSGNGTPTVNIVRPSKGGVSHNKFREYNIDTRGVILNNSGLGGSSVIGGSVTPNPNLTGGKAAKIIVNEVTGTKRSNLNGVTEVFGAKADVIVANPNGIGCVGCGFINTGSATLTTGVPVVDYDAGTVGFDTRQGDITISGAGVSAPAGQLPDDIRLIGKSIDIDGLVDVRGKVELKAGSSRTDGASGATTALGGDAAGTGLLSSAAGVVRGGLIEALSYDVGTDVVLAGNLQALGNRNDKGEFVPGSLTVVSAGDLRLTSGEVAGNAQLRAAQALQIARDLSASGEIAVVANDISFLETAGLHSGKNLSIVASADIVSNATLKAGGTLKAQAGGDAAFSGLIASAGDMELKAEGALSTNKATLVAPGIGLTGDSVTSTSTWIVPGREGAIDAANIELGKDTVIDAKVPVNVTAAERLSIGTTIDAAKYPGLALAFRDLTITDTGVLAFGDKTLDVGNLSNAGVLLSSGQLAVNADTLSNEATGIIKAGTIRVDVGGDLKNLGQILSEGTMSLLADGRLVNDGGIGANADLKLEALSYEANSDKAELVARNADIILGKDLINNGAILAFGAADIEAGGRLDNKGVIRSNANLTLVAADVINSGADALIGSNADLSIHSGTITNTLGSLQANGSFELVSSGTLVNSGLIYAKTAADLAVAQLTNLAEGKLHAGRIAIDLGQGALTNLGQIVSADTIAILKGGQVSNSGDIQSRNALRLEAQSYEAGSETASLVASQADLILKGGLTNAGLIAVAERLNLEAGSLTNEATGEIIARQIEAKVTGDLTNLGKVLSEETLKATVTGLATNAGAMQANGDLNLTVRDLTNSGVNAVISSAADVTIDASGALSNFEGTLLANNALSLTGGGALANSGLLQGDNLSVKAASLSNRQSGSIIAASANASAARTRGAAPAGELTVRLTGDLANLGQIASTQSTDIEAATAANSGSITSMGDLRLKAVSYEPGSPSAKLAAYNLNLILSGSYTNRGELGAIGLLDLDIGGDFTNTADGKIAAANIDAAIGGNLTNLGSIVSEQALRAVVNGLLTNEGSIRSGTVMILEAAKLVNRGENALIETAGDMSIKTSGDLENSLGTIRAAKTLGIEAGGTVTNASARIESGLDMQIVAKTLLNTAIDGTDGGVRDHYALGELTVDYSYDEDDHVFSTDHETFISAQQHEFSGQIRLDKPGTIRSGRDLIIKTDITDNEEGRILAVRDLSIETRLLNNDAQVYTVDHFVNEWGRKYDDDWVPFTPPAGSNVRWGVYKWSLDAINEDYYKSLIDALPRREVTKTRQVWAGSSPTVGATYQADGPNGPGYYKTETYKVEEVEFGTRWETVVIGSDRDGNPREFRREVPATYPRAYFDTDEGKTAYLSQLNLLVAKGESPVSIRGSDDVSQSKANDIADLEMVENVVDASLLLNFAALGIDPDNIPSVIVVTNREPDELGTGDYRFKGKEKVGVADVLNGSLIKAGGTLSTTALGANFVNRGTFDGNLVVIEGSTLDNGVGPVTGFDPSQLGLVDPTLPGNVISGNGATIGLNGGLSGSVDFVLDDVSVPPLNLGAFNDRNIYSVDGSNFGNLARFTGSAEAARLIGSALIDGNTIRFYSDPVAEARALADAALKAAGTHLVVDASMSLEEQREQLYSNAAEFASRTGAQYGVALTEAQRAALDKPIVWHETRIIDGKAVLVPRLYLPSNDELLRGPRGAGLINAGDLIVDLGGPLKNSGAIVAAGLASISASSIINERMANLDDMSREFAAGRGDSGLISAGTLFMATDADLINRGGSIAAAGDIDLRIGGSLVNETQRYDRAVDSFDLCLGNACGAKAVDYNIAKITAGRDLTVIADKDIVNRGGELGSVTNMLLAAGRNVEFETLKDAYLVKDYHQRGFLSGTDIVEHAIVTADAAAQSLVGDVSIFAGYGVCDGGSLCSEGKAPGDVILNGALVTAFGNLAVDATGKIEMGAVSKEVENQYKDWGFKGLGWGTVKQKWNDIDTSVTRLSGYDVTLNAKGPITGTGVKIAAVNDLLMKTDDTIRLEAAQDALYFTEKGFYIGLTFPGSAGIDAALRGGDGREILSGLAGVNPLTATLARLANADNGLAAGFAAVDLITGGASVFGGAAKAGGGGDTLFSRDAFSRALNDRLNPLSQFTDENGNFSFKNFGISLSMWKKDNRWSESQISELTAGGDIVMKAGLDVLLTQGTKLVAGGDVDIDAGRDIIMSALLDYARDKSSSFGLQISLSSIGFDIAKSEGYDEQLLNASIAAAGDVRMKSGRDIAMLGGNIAGRNVSLDVGRDLTILSPQAKGWREGFSFGLTVGWSPFEFGIRGSKEDGEKAWSSPSGIIAAQNINIKVAEDTMLAGALLQATDGDINLDTGTLVSVDLNDTDQYTNVGGSIGINGSGLSSIGFHYENKDKQGVTRTTLDAGGDLNVTIRDADGDGEFDTPEDKLAAQQFLAAVNKDASKYQEILKDSYTNLSGELNVQNLREFGENLRAIQNYNRAQNALVPAEIEAQGARAVDVWRKMIINGATPEQATAIAGSDPLFGVTVKKLQSVDAAIAEYGSIDRLPPGTLTLIAMGQTLLFGEASNYKGGAVLVPCASNGVCQVELATYLQTLKQNPNSVAAAIADFRNEVVTGLTTGFNDDAANGGPFRLEAAFRNLLNCVSDNPANASDDLLAAYRANPTGFQALVYRTADTTRVNPQTVLAAVEGLAGGGSTAQFMTDMNLAQLPRSTALDGVVTVAGVLYELTPVADTVAIIQAADSGDIAGVMIAGVGFLPIAKAAKLLGKSASVVEATFKAGGDEAADLAADTVKLLPAPSAATPSLRRLAPGVASHAGDLPRIADGQTWLKGTAGNAGKVPAQIAEQLAGQNFRDFNEFREAFWTAVSRDPVLRGQFSRQNQARMENGLAPFAVDVQGVGGRQTYELDHMMELQNGGSVYDMNNIIIRTPLNHIKGKT